MNPLHNMRCTLTNKKRGSLNIQLENVFRAVETRDIVQLREHLSDAESCVNGQGGAFYITPLHAAVELGWQEGVQALLLHGASICSRNQYDQTPLHYAAAAKQEEILKILLEHCNNSSSTINLRDMRGTSAIHEGAVSGSLVIVKILLKQGAEINTRDKQGESPLHKAAKIAAYDVMVALMEHGAHLQEKDSRGISALQWLTLTTPDGLQRLLDHLLITSVAGNRRSPVTFNFAALVGDSGTKQCQLLSHFIETNNCEILAHPVCHVFLLIKWKRAKFVFLGYLLYFVVYALLTGLCLFNRLLWTKCLNHNQTKAQHQNDTGCALKQSSTLPHLWMNVCLCIQNLILLLSQFNRIRLQGFAYLKVPSFWLQIISDVCVLSLLLSSWQLGPAKVAIWEHHIATIVFLLLQLQFLLILRKYPSNGLYVAMFMRVTEDFLRIFFIYCTLLVCFTLTLYLAFNREQHNDPVYKSGPLLFLKSLTMMVGSIDVNIITAQHLDRLPYTGYLIFMLFILIISIVLANLLVALAVSDIRELRSTADLMRLASMVDAIRNIEQLCDFPILRHLADYCRLDTRSSQVRVWPQDYARQPSVLVQEPHASHYCSSCPRCCVWLRDFLHRSRYEISIPATLQAEVLNRITARDYVTQDVEQNNSDQGNKKIYTEILKTLKSIEISLSR